MASEKEQATAKRWQDMNSAELAEYIENEEHRHRESDFVKQHKATMRHLRAVLRALLAEGT